MRGRTVGLSMRPASVVADAPGGSAAGSAAGSKRNRQRVVRELVTTTPIQSQQELADRLIARGFAVTQATVSRDIAELGLLKAPRDGRHVYVVPEAIGTAPAGSASSPAVPARSDERLRRILAEIPVTVGRSGLILLLTGSAGTASVIAQAIDESSLVDQEGTLAGDNTLIVLFSDEARLVAWRERFDEIRAAARAAAAP
jgi:transcriptional regulator of arginine metabolism